jgi:hypothetical protein
MNTFVLSLPSTILWIPFAHKQKKLFLQHLQQQQLQQIHFLITQIAPESEPQEVATIYNPEYVLCPDL